MDESSEIILDVQHLAKEYPGPDGSSVAILRDVSFTLSRGQSLAVVGPSGCGKSTLLNLLGGLDRPTGGKVMLAGRDLAALSPNELSAARNRQIGFVFQLHHLLPQCTALENVLVPTLASGDRRMQQEARGRAVELLGRVGLADRLEYRPGQLSGGECQRVAVVRALINKPVLLLADEPTGSLDPSSAGNLADMLAELEQAQRVAMVVVTHSAQLAARLGRVMHLRDGVLAE